MTSLSPSVNFENYPSPNFTESRNEGSPKILVMHCTACPIDEALNTLTSRTSQVSAFMSLQKATKYIASLKKTSEPGMQGQQNGKERAI